MKRIWLFIVAACCLGPRAFAADPYIFGKADLAGQRLEIVSGYQQYCDAKTYTVKIVGQTQTFDIAVGNRPTLSAGIVRIPALMSDKLK